MIFDTLVLFMNLHLKDYSKMKTDVSSLPLYLSCENWTPVLVALMRLQVFFCCCLTFEICERIAFCSFFFCFVFGDDSTELTREIGFDSFSLLCLNRAHH